MIAVNAHMEETSNCDLDNLALENFRLLDDYHKALVLYTMEKFETMTEEEFDEVEKDPAAFYKQIEAEMNAKQQP